VALHDLRKRAKELRYLLECFQTLYPETERGAFIRELKALQDNLGEFQDCQVQAATLRDMADDLIAKGAPAATLMAMGGLAAEQEAREAEARAEFSRRFQRFASQENRKRMAALTHRERA
jgi:CHAD domain-containing protein